MLISTAPKFTSKVVTMFPDYSKTSFGLGALNGD